MRYLIDTDIASYFLRGRYNMQAVFEKKGVSNLTLSVITVAQMEVLAYKNPYSRINMARIAELADLLGAIELDRNTWKIFSMTTAEKERIGQPRGDLDILQASIAKQQGLVVATHNTDHYEGIVECEDWTNETG